MKHTSRASGAQRGPPGGHELVTVAVRPDALVQVPAGELAELQRRAAEPIPAVLSTAQAEKHFGRKSKWWRERAIAGEIEGAYREGAPPRAVWRIPRQAAERFIAALDRKHSNGGLRGPRNKKGAPARPHPA